jgi:Sporulation and spore germination
MSRNLKIILAVLAVLVAIGLISVGGLWRRVQRLEETPKSEEEARQEVLAPPISTASDVNTNAKIFWAAGPDSIAPVDVAMPLSADPVERSKQLLQELITKPPSASQRTIPAEAVLTDFYILADGTAVADFSDALSSDLPSGILSESMAVNSIVDTLASNVAGLRRLKILIHGQEVDTLAGHVDLTGFFDLTPPGAPPSVPGVNAPAQSGAAAPPATLPARPATAAVGPSTKSAH